jgi:drug/metabolite transporter (DMT)-like permease
VGNGERVPSYPTADPAGMKVGAGRRGYRLPLSRDAVGAVLIGLASMQFGAVVVLGKIVTQGGLPVPSMLAFRFVIAALLLAAVLAGARQPLRAAPGEGWKLAGLGLAGYAVEATFFFEAIRHGSAPAVTVLFFTYPVLVSLIALVLGKGLPGWLLGGALGAAVAGAAVVSLTGGGVEIDGAGVAFALGSAASFALYLTGAAAALKGTNSLTGAMWVSAAAGLGLAAYSLVAGAGRIPEGWRQWGPVIGMAAFTAGAFFCLFAGLRRLGVVRTSILAATEPLAASVLAAIFLDEPIRGGTVAGGALILSGAIAAALARRPAHGPAEAPVP